MGKFFKFVLIVLLFLFIDYSLVFFFNNGKRLFVKADSEYIQISEKADESKEVLFDQLNQSNLGFWDKLNVFLKNISDVVFVFFVKSLYPIFASIDNDVSNFITNDTLYTETEYNENISPIQNMSSTPVDSSQNVDQDQNMNSK